MKEILMCEPCCGSCGYFGHFMKDHGCSRLKIAEIYAKDEACKGYYPRSPIKVFMKEEKDDEQN